MGWESHYKLGLRDFEHQHGQISRITKAASGWPCGDVLLLPGSVLNVGTSVEEVTPELGFEDEVGYDR